MPASPGQIAFADVLAAALTEPGRLSSAVRAFHGFSLGNQLSAAWQCTARGLPYGPLATFRGWQERGRQVRRGEKALWLCMPVTVRRDAAEGDALPATPARTAFVWRPRWFTLAQTDGPSYDWQAELPAWQKEAALTALGIAELPFDPAYAARALGYCTAAGVAVSPLAPEPHKVLFHELAHALLAHAGSGLPQADRELEAEGVALLAVHALGLSGTADSRAYLQHFAAGRCAFSEAQARRIIATAERIVRAGQEVA